MTRWCNEGFTPQEKLKNPLKIALTFRASVICKNFNIFKYYLISVGMRCPSLIPASEVFNHIKLIHILDTNFGLLGL